MPKVSVIVPVYGVEKYIERCARSLFEQTLDDIEYLFIDDCTPDRSIEVLKSALEDYPNRKPQVIIHRMEQNSGQAAVREWGMLNASGDFVIHCDSDDWVDVTMYEKLYNKAKENDSDVVICDYEETNDREYHRTIKGAHSTNRATFIESCLFQHSSWSLCNKLFRWTDSSTKIIYPTGALGEDMVICAQLLIKAQRLDYVQEGLYHYFVNFSSITKKITVALCEQNYRFLKENTDLVLNIISKENVPLERYRLSDVEKYLRFNNLVSLLPVRHLSKYRSIWNREFQFFPFMILCNRYISSYNKKLYFASLLPFYPFKSGRASV